MISPLTSLRFLFALMVFGAHLYTIDPYFDHLFYKEGFVGVNFFLFLADSLSLIPIATGFLNKSLPCGNFGWLVSHASIRFIY